MAQHNKTALVTGASRGIGRATALALAETSAHMLVHYGRSAQEAQSLVERIHSKGGRADAIRADLGTPEGVTLLANEVPRSALIASARPPLEWILSTKDWASWAERP